MNNLETKYLNHYVLIYTDCKTVIGIKNAVIHDLTKKEIYKIPAAYGSLISLFKEKKLGEIKNTNTKEDWANILIFIHYLIDNKLATYVKDVSLFPEMELKWDAPNRIVNAIIDYTPEVSKYSLKDSFSQLSMLDCKHVEIRTYSPFSNDFLTNVLSIVQPLLFSSLDIICKTSNEFDITSLTQIIKENHVLNKITITNALKNELIEVDRFSISTAYLMQTTQSFDSEKQCGIINHKSLYSPSIKAFSENHHFNSCLNRKISIDKNGEIKNCPSMQQSYGNIHTTALSKVLENSAFTKKWTIKKSMIKTCKSCEFRYMCTDCRAFVTDPKEAYSKPLKCGYNPASGVWTDWMKNELTKKSISVNEE